MIFANDVVLQLDLLQPPDSHHKAGHAPYIVEPESLLLADKPTIFVSVFLAFSVLYHLLCDFGIQWSQNLLLLISSNSIIG
jgi:hypothetical protein